MSKSKRPESENPQMVRATNKGQVNTQAQSGAPQPGKDNTRDQSEGAKAEGQPTAMHGQGAGFSRKTH